MTDRVGQQLGNYRLVSLLGQGGFAEVYLGQHVRLNLQAAADPGVRQQVFEQIHQIYLTQFPFIVLYARTLFAMAHKGTHNYLPGPNTDTYNIAEWCDGGKC